MRRNTATFRLCCALALTAAAGLCSADGVHALKSAFIFNFTRFIGFPSESLPEGHPFVVGIEGRDDYGKDLVGALTGKTVDSHGFVVRRVKTREEIRSCQLVIVGETGANGIRRVLHMTEGAPIVTLGDGPEFTRLGGVIGFVQADDRIRFDVNLEAAHAAHVSISSRMLELARTVLRGS